MQTQVIPSSNMKVGRNDRCPCGSGKKYKRCCLGKEFGPVPDEVIQHFQKVRAEQEYLKQAGIHINYVKPIMFTGTVHQTRLSIPFLSKFLKKQLVLIGSANKQNCLKGSVILSLSVLKNLA